MPVLVEGISVIVRRDAIDRSYQGGWQDFLSDVPNQTLCMDAQIARVGFMNPIDVREFLKTMAKRGLTVTGSSGDFVDLVVIDQLTGRTAPCTWIEALRLPFQTGHIGVARMRGNTDRTIVSPAGWSFEKSLSKNSEFQPGVEPNENHEFVRVENGVDVYRDRRDGREFFVRRTTPP